MVYDAAVSALRSKVGCQLRLKVDRPARLEDYTLADKEGFTGASPWHRSRLEHWLWALPGPRWVPYWEGMRQTTAARPSLSCSQQSLLPHLPSTHTCMCLYVLICRLLPMIMILHCRGYETGLLCCTKTCRHGSLTWHYPCRISAVKFAKSVCCMTAFPRSGDPGYETADAAGRWRTCGGIAAPEVQGRGGGAEQSLHMGALWQQVHCRLLTRAHQSIDVLL